MNRKLLLIFFCIAYLPCFAQEKSLLWEISGNDLAKPSYLYGTMHIADSRIFQFSDSVMIVFKKCTAYAGEIIIDKKASQTTAKLIFMPGDTTLAMLIGDTGLVKVKKRLKGKMLLFSGIVNKIKPFFTLALLSEGAFKHNKSSSLDEYFQKIAKKNKLGVIGIETIEEQMAAVDKIPLTTQAQMLLDEVEHPNNEADTSAIEMLKTYLHQDIETLQGYLTEESTPEEMNKYILQERNVVMAKRIHKIIQMQPTFIGIGAAHLGGTNGIINILKIKGYKLRAVNAPFKK